VNLVNSDGLPASPFRTDTDLGGDPAAQSVRVADTRCEHLAGPRGVDAARPVLSWRLTSDARGQHQTAYRILVSESAANLRANVGEMWDSKKVASDNNLSVAYAGRTLHAARTYYWKVMVWDAMGTPSDWSEVAAWHMGLLTREDWGRARWIGYEELADSMRVVPGIHMTGESLGGKCVKRVVVPYFRREFTVRKSVASAELFITGLGQYEAYLNGTRIGASFLDPGWTDYRKTILYNSYDVTPLLRTGENALGAVVGNGFFNINRERYRKLTIAFGNPMLLSRLVITYADGSRETIDSGEEWKASPSPVTYTSIFGGEDYDARLEQPGWNEPGFADAGWRAAVRVDPPAGRLRGASDHPIRVHEMFDPVRIAQTVGGSPVYDFGQNASGIVELTVKGRKGQEIVLTPAELLDSAGLPYQDASGKPFYFTYTLKGDSAETWRPRFTYYGFRYVQAKGAVPRAWGAPADTLPQIISMRLLHTRNASPVNGSFDCSDTLFNRIHSLINWAIKSNIQSVVTDCPHREKLGWLEVTHLMGNSIRYNFDVRTLYQKIVADMMDAQLENGLVPDIAPEYVPFDGGFRDSPEWGSASVILPWMLYTWYGDTATMAKAWPMMTRYAAYLGTKADGHILSHGLGDWFDMGPNAPGEAQLTPKSLTATAIYYYDIALLARMAAVLHKSADEKKFRALGESVRAAFNKKFFNAATNVYSTGSQTAMSMPYCVGLVDESRKAAVLRNLADTIVSQKKALTAGDIGFHYLVAALSEGGASQLLCEMNQRTDVPGYGYQLGKGATTLTESWPALEFVSNNHMMLGHLMEWFYSSLGGIRQAEGSRAFRSIVIAPELVGAMTHARTSFRAPDGEIRTEWKRTARGTDLEVVIPVNTTARIYLPGPEAAKITEGGVPLAQSKGVRIAGADSGRTVAEVGSGTYTFSIEQ